MTIPYQVTFHGGADRNAVDGLITERVERLTHVYPRASSCRVVVDIPNHTHKRGNSLEVTIEVGIPGRDPIIVHHRDDDCDNVAGIQRAVRDGFAATERQLRDLHERLIDARRSEHKA